MRLLILKCSSRKRGGAALLPAIERYDGPLWQVLRAYLRAHPRSEVELDIYGLSAEFGLIASTQRIPRYDRTMSAERAHQLHPTVIKRFRELGGRGYEDICLGISERYLVALRGWEQCIPERTRITITDGGVGTKLGQLSAWLRGQVWDKSDHRPDRLEAPVRPRGRAVIKGVPISMAPDEVLDRARQALCAETNGANHYRDWYVLVDGRPVAAKWLVSQISGLPTTEFDAAAARRILLALGIGVERTRP